MKNTYHLQMSDSYLVAALLSLTGGFQDAYTYICRGGVFANAQTGNIVLAGQALASGFWLQSLEYLVPIAAFIGGVYLAQVVRMRFRYNRKLHWRQIILLLEIAILFIVGLLPVGFNVTANVLVSFTCALQVDSFRTIHGNTYATTMCIGNLRTATDLLYSYEVTKDPVYRRRSMKYYFLILVFLLGAALGGIAIELAGLQAIWFCCVAMLLSFVTMFIHQNIIEEVSPTLDTDSLRAEMQEIWLEIAQYLHKNTKPPTDTTDDKKDTP